MFANSSKIFLALLAASLSEMVLGREVLLEREGRAVALYPRRFGAENPPVIQKLSGACPGQVCGVLAGKAITPLLAAQPECSQQDMADEIIDAAKQFDAATQANMIALAIEYRQSEKNTPPDFTTNPPSLRNSVFCQKAPKNPELNGLVQAQDPNNDPNLFFDPATKATVTLGSQPNTFPFGGAGAAAPPPPAPVVVDEPPVVEEPPVAVEVPAAPVVAAPAAGNLQPFTGALGCILPPTVTEVAPGTFQVENNASFNNLNSALRRSCDVQVNLCSNAANASGNQGDLTVANCGAQGNQCRANL
ncbi:hypothetical protein ONZ45_g2205 [Pleurotus djamor]|nr:hypothetical protein ONZ45_g2205 [Pleurotus djamor]